MSHDESLARTYEERKAQRLRECGVVTAPSIVWETIEVQRSEIRRLRRALREIVARADKHRSETGEASLKAGCLCYECIATRALKGKG